MKKRKSLFVALFLVVLTLGSLQAQAAWKKTSAGKIYTTTGSPGYYTGWKLIDGVRYYFDPSNGVMATGFKKIQAGKKVYTYYFDAKGKSVFGFATIDGVNYYFSKKKGRLQHGYLKIDGKVYHADVTTGALAKDTWVDVYYFQNDCTMATNTWVYGKWVGADGRYTGVKNNVGFVRDNGVTYYYDRNSRMVSGWLQLNGKSYYLKPALATGWFKVGSYTYYAENDGVVAKSAWRERKYLTSSGAAASGWTTIGSDRYYFDADGNYVSGPYEINGKVYLFKKKGALRNKTWYTTGGKRYYFGADGARVYGRQLIGGKYYYFNTKTGELMLRFFFDDNGVRYYAQKKQGYLLMGRWLKVNGYKYYAKADGRLATGLNTIDGKIYGFSPNKGLMYKERKKTFDGNTYYFQKDGSAVTGQWYQIKGKYYYFNKNGVMAKNTVVDGYQIDAKGVRGEKAVGGWVTSNGVKRYVVGGTAVTGWQNISGGTYYFDSNAGMVTGIQEIDGKKYYFYPTGLLAVNVTLAVGEKEYTINYKGVVTAEQTINISGNTTGSKIAKFAIQYVGNKYVYGGTSLTNGADCSGFVQTVFAQYGIKLLRVADDQMDGPTSGYIAQGYKKAVVVSASSMLPGDLVFYGSDNYASHVAIYIGSGNIVHASNSQPYPAGGIKISPYNYQQPIRIVRYWS